MSNIYSERLLQHLAVNAWGEFVVPAGKRMVLQTVCSTAGTSTQSYVEVVLDGTYLFFFSFPAPGSEVKTDLRAVGYAGSRLQVNHSGSLLWTSCYGYLFDDPGGELAQQLPFPFPPEAIQHDPPPGHVKAP